MHRIPAARRAALAGALALVLPLGAAALDPPTAAAAPVSGTAAAGTVTTGGKCLDDADFGTANGTVVQVFTCNGSSAQAWTWQPDGTVRVYGKCLDVTGASNANGALVQLYDCVSGVPQQKFAHLPDGTIYSTKSGKCLAVQGATVNNARIGLAPCDPANSAQQWTAATAPPPAYTVSAGPAVSWGNADDTPASVYLDKNGQFYYQQAHSLYGPTDSRQWKFFTGTHATFDTAYAAGSINSAVNPANPADRNDDTTWRCDNSPTGVVSSYAPSRQGFSERNYCDLSGVWVDPDTGDWHGLVHNEFTPDTFSSGLHYDGIDTAVSKDQGRTWSITGRAITSPYSTARDDSAQFPQQSWYYGDGDQRLFTDYASGYFYVFYASRTLSKGPGGQVWEQHVARAPISGKMAAGSWQKWYDGSWQSPGVGGAESDIIPADGGGSGYIAPGDDYRPTTAGSTAAQVGAGTSPDNSQLAVMNIAWDAYLGKYIGTPQNSVAQNTGTRTPLHFYATDDLATQKWTDLGLLDSDPNGAWYRWFLDSGSLTSSTVLGRTFRSYCSFECSTYTGEYHNVTIAPTSPAGLPTPPVSATATYRITAGNGQYLTLRGDAVTVGTGATADRRWRFTATGDGFFTVTDASSGRPLTVDAGTDAGRAWGAAVTLGASGTTAGVGGQWSVQRVTGSGPTAYRLVNRYSGLALSLSGTAATSPQRTWDPTGTAPGGDTRTVAAQTLAFTG
ncbi:ricin-type beta-trefoil lectin domain protein [Actinacidiphila alni]|uniref:ricin-type beta-trefoil lectin domain protein n=1 Tax=Actinacidiphila alni TaxID=380248 RepID=UPI003406FAED